MKSKRKALIMVLCAVLLVSTTMFATIAYLKSEANVNNTFTVGNVHITLDETKVDEYGSKDGNERVTENEYKLIPGHKYIKDPTVTVIAGSEDCYVRALVTLNKRGALYDLPNDIKIEDCFNISSDWKYIGETEGDDTNTYEFWYKTKVEMSTTDTVLPSLFTTISVPNSLTNAQLETLTGLQINVVAHAIQADGFDTADDAWEAFGN